MKTLIKLLEKLQLALLVALPALVFASRLVPLVALPLTALLSLPRVFKKLPLALPLYLAFSLLWSARTSRGALVLGLFLCILITALAYRSLWSSERGLKFRNYLETSLLIGATFASLFCLAQFVADLLGAPKDLTLLCSGCTKATFGFPHVNGFALEPQFMGALLLAPVFLCLKNFKTSKIYPVLLCFFSVTLFLTFSRGAYLALFAGLCFSLVSHFKPRKPVEKSVENSQKPTKSPIFLPLTLIFTSFIAVFALQSALGHHFRPETAPTPLEHLTSQTDSSPVTAESQNIRLRLWSDAFHAWTKNPTTFLFGVGLGGSGPALHAVDPALGTDTEIVQNEYLELLLELGFVGCVILLGTLIRLGIPKKPLTVASLTALLFFSGLPNATGLYLLLFSGSPEAPQKHLPPKTRAKGRSKAS